MSYVRCVLIFCLYASFCEAQLFYKDLPNPNVLHGYERKRLFEGCYLTNQRITFPEFYIESLSAYGVKPKEQKIKTIECDNITYEFDSIGRLLYVGGKGKDGSYFGNYKKYFYDNFNLIEIEAYFFGEQGGNTYYYKFHYDENNRVAKGMGGFRAKKGDLKLDTLSFKYDSFGYRTPDYTNIPRGYYMNSDRIIYSPLYHELKTNIERFKDSVVENIRFINTSKDYLKRTYIINNDKILKVYENSIIQKENYFDDKGYIIQVDSYEKEYNVNELKYVKKAKTYSYCLDGRLQDNKLVKYDKKNMPRKFNLNGKWHKVKYTYYK